MKRVKKWNFQVKGEWDESQENDFSWMVSCKITYVFATGEKAIGTGWTVAPPEEEESNWGGTILSM